MDNTDLCVLVEGPAWGDAKFYGEWLLAAAKAESLWKEALEDQDFKGKIETASFWSTPDFGIAATMMLMRLKSHQTRFVIDIHSEQGEDLAMMFGMGFFVRKHQSYQMTLPSCLTVEKVRAAVIKYAETEDVECVLHPEDLVTTMPFAKATALQDRLRAVDAVLSLRSIAKDLAGSAEGAGIGGAAQGGCTLYRQGGKFRWNNGACSQEPFAMKPSLARGVSASAACVEASYKPNRHNAAALACERYVAEGVKYG